MPFASVPLQPSRSPWALGFCAARRRSGAARAGSRASFMTQSAQLRLYWASIALHSFVFLMLIFGNEVRKILELVDNGAASLTHSTTSRPKSNSVPNGAAICQSSYLLLALFC